MLLGQFLDDILGRIPAWLVLVIIVREFVITGLRGVAASTGTVVAANPGEARRTLSPMA